MPIVDNIKKILKVNIKPRNDTYSDQYSRIFMVKFMMVGALLIGMNWHSDKVNCMIPQSISKNTGFLTSACWINGFFVYENIRYHADELGFYGLPRDIKHDGMFADGQLCNTKVKSQVGCQPMEKTFFLQYQYMTFVMGALALLYYSPYAFFKLVNLDIISLKGSIKGSNAEDIVRNYFNHRVNSPSKMHMRIVGDILVKVIYITVNVVALLILDGVLNNGFITYGVLWSDWAKLDNAVAYDYMGMRHSPKPGNALLPTFGFCEVRESAKDIKTVVINEYRFVCEISQHVLYQYVLILLWFAMIFGIVVSIIGLLGKFIGHMITMTCFLKSGPHARQIYKMLTLRECEYLELIRRNDLPLYNEVCRKLDEMCKGRQVDDMHADDPPQYNGTKA